MEEIIKRILNPVLKLFHQSWDAPEWENFFQFVKFSLIGISNVAVSYTINISTLFILRSSKLQFDYVIANVTAFLLSVLWSFHWNSRYVFDSGEESTNWRMKALLKTYMSYAFTGVILNNVLSTIWICVLGISKYISPFLNLPFTIPVNYLMQKLWAYRKRENIHEKQVNKNK